MALKRLFKSGLFDSLPAGQSVADQQGAIPEKLDKRVMLVYAGKFESMDGEVEITEETLHKLAANHNSFLSRIKQLAGSEEIPVRRCPPLQLDHSRSARDTVGRLVGPVEVGTHLMEDGTPVVALFGNARILGRENVEPVLDGRWAEVSIGADLDNDRIAELSITPFPAAAEAAMLARPGDTVSASRKRVLSQDYKSYSIAVWENVNGALKSFEPEIKGEEWVGDALQFESQELAFDWIRKQIDGETLTIPRASRLAEGEKDAPPTNPTRPVVEDAEGGDKHRFSQRKVGMVVCDSCAQSVTDICTKCFGARCQECHKKIFGLSKGEPAMDKAKLKKHLMDTTKCTEEEADKKLAEMPEDDQKKLAAQIDEDEKKLAAEETEKQRLAAEAEADAEKDEEKKKGEAKLARKEKLSKLSTDFRSTGEEVRLAARKASIHTRLMGLRSSAKITPAEIKKIDLTALAKKGDEAVNAVMKSYEDREPVIPTGALGSIKAANLSSLGGKESKIAKQASESLSNMSFTRKALENTAKLSKGKKRLGEQPTEVEVHIDATPHDHFDFEGEYNHVCGLMDANPGEAKTHLKGLFDRVRKHLSGVAEGYQGDQVEMSALVAKVEMMQNHFDDVLKLAEAE